MPKTRVLVADDHPLLRTGLRSLINTQPDMEVVGEAVDHQQALGKARELKPDVITLDLTMPDGTGVMVIKTIVQELPQTRVVVLTMHDHPAYFRAAMAAGALGFVVKKAADSELLDAIRCVARGRVFSHAELAPNFGVGPSNSRAQSPLNLLSDREREVMILIAQGHTNQAIAVKLHLSVKTVESYRARLMSKLGLRSRAELTQLAVDTGLLTSGSSVSSSDS